MTREIVSVDVSVEEPTFGGKVTGVCVHIVRHALVLISLLVDAGLSFAAAQMKLDATYTATLLGVPLTRPMRSDS